MKYVRRRFVVAGASIAAVAALSVLAIGVGGAATGSATTHRFTLHARVVQLDDQTSIAELTGGPNAGKWGAQIAHYRASGTTVRGASTAYNRKGSTFGPFKLTVRPQADGSVDITGSSQVKGGTGIFRGAHGSAKITGTVAAGSTIGRYIYKVTLTY